MKVAWPNDFDDTAVAENEEAQQDAARDRRPVVVLGLAGSGKTTVVHIAIADAAAHIGKLVRVTLADGSRERNRLVAVEGGSITLKRDKSEGSGHYSIAVAKIVRMEVFDR